MNQFASIIQQLVGQQIASTKIDQNLVPQVAEETGNSLLSGLTNAFKDGNASEIMSLFTQENSNLASNPMVGQIISGLASNLGTKFGIDSAQASTFASSVIPLIINFISSKSGSGASGFNVTDLISGLSGNNSGGFLDNLGAFGLDKNGDGKVDFKDALSALTGDNKDDKSGGLGGMLGNLFGK